MAESSATQPLLQVEDLVTAFDTEAFRETDAEPRGKWARKLYQEHMTEMAASAAAAANAVRRDDQRLAEAVRKQAERIEAEDDQVTVRNQAAVGLAQYLVRIGA